MIRALNHINLVVSNLERSVQFYTTLLGFKEVRRAHLEGKWIESIVGLKGVRAEVVYLLAPAGEPRLELLYYESPRGKWIQANSLANTIGLRHIAFQVEDIHKAVKHLKIAAGVWKDADPRYKPAQKAKETLAQIEKNER